MKTFPQDREAAEEMIFAGLMADFARKQGQWYDALNEQLVKDPSAAVPEEVSRRCLDRLLLALQSRGERR